MLFPEEQRGAESGGDGVSRRCPGIGVRKRNAFEGGSRSGCSGELSDCSARASATLYSAAAGISVVLTKEIDIAVVNDKDSIVLLVHCYLSGDTTA